MGSSGQDSVQAGKFLDGYFMGEFIFFFNIFDLDFLYSTNAIGAIGEIRDLYLILHRWNCMLKLLQRQFHLISTA